MMDGICHHQLESWDMWCLTDGTYTFGNEDFPSLDDDTRAASLAAAGLTAIDTVFNAFLLKDAAGEFTLIDCGCGAQYGDAAGQVKGHLATLNVAPDSISRLIFTHLHDDHCGGALENGARTFPNAQVFVHTDEAAFWQQIAHFSRDVLDAYADQTTLVRGGIEIAPGLIAVALPGHTAGHMGILVADEVLIFGDCVHSEALQLPDTSVCSVHDKSPEDAIASRNAVFARIADENLVFSGGHILGADKFARLRRDARGYAKVPL